MASVEQEIFSVALECATDAERAAYLEASCRDQPELRRRVEALLQAEAEAGGFLSGGEHEPGERPGTRIHGYVLRERIGEGGFGTVYRADQVTPLRRTVALKILKLGMDTRAIVARFEAERQTLALMEHPHIARVLDGGATENGRPYFVMEFVAGDPITTYCTERRLALGARLELFLQVCRAVHHAHQKGVIHRDLKPSNILVTEQERRPVVKVIDFGIAKATCDPLAPHTQFTRMPGLLGTPAYMSPEQMGLGGPDIDTRADIYSLGALLYELLTDLTPFSAAPAGNLLELQRVLQRSEPEAPSRRVAGMPVSELVAAAERRRSEADSFVAEMRGDLDRIVLKCLAKDRTQRYETTEDLARDVQRYLRDEPVLARAPTVLYRASKFCRRHRPSVALAVLALLVFAALLVFHSRRLAEERDRAQLEARKAAKVGELLTEIVTSGDPYRTPSQQGVLEASALRVRQEFPHEPEVRAEILNAIGRVHLRRGENSKAQPILEEALRAAREIPRPDMRLAQTLSNLGVLYSEQGNGSAAVAMLTEALALRRELLGNRNNEVAICLVELGRAQLARERIDLAEPLFRGALEIRRAVLGPEDRETAVSLGDLAVLLWQKGDLAGAEPYFAESIAAHRKSVGPTHPNVGHSLSNLALLRLDQSRLAEAETLLRESIAILQGSFGPDHWRIARGRATLAEVWRRQGRLPEAAAEFAAAVRLARDALGPDRPLVASLLVDQGRLQLDQGNLAEAEATLREALRVQRLTGVENGWRIATTKSLLGGVLLRRGQREEAARWLGEATRVLRDIPGPQGRETKATQERLAELGKG